MEIFKKITKQPALLVLILWFGIAWSWTLSTDSLNLAGSKSQGILLAILISSINVAISVVVIWNAIRIVKFVFSKYNPWLATAIGLPIFALADFLVSWLTTIIWIGPQGQIDNILPLSSPTLLIINTPLGFTSRIVGFYGLAGFVWLILFLLCSKKYRPYVIAPATALVLIAGFSWFLYKNPNGTEFKAKIISETLEERVAPIDPSGTDLVVFPEYGLDQVENDQLNQRILMNTPDDPNKSYFLGSEQVNPIDKTGHINRLLFGNTVDGYTYKQDKYRLIPGGEDLPYTLRFGLRATNQKSTLDYFSYAKGTLKGNNQLKPFQINETTLVGAAVCSSIIAPHDYRQFAANGATVFTNSASLTIFKGSPIFSFQQKSLARFMAIANARYFLQSANSATAYALDQNGNTITESGGNVVIDVDVQNNTKKTIYTYAGEWLVPLGIILCIWLFISIKKSDTNNKKPKKKAKTT